MFPQHKLTVCNKVCCKIIAAQLRENAFLIKMALWNVYFTPRKGEENFTILFRCLKFF